MTNLKNDFTLQLHIHLQQISLRQSTIATLPKSMSDLEELLLLTKTSSKTGFQHLDRLRNMTRAYGLTCVEVIWRKNVAEVLLETTGKLAENVSGFLTNESKRRRDFGKQVLELLPPNEVEGLVKSEMFVVGLELSVKSGLEDSQDWDLTEGDVTGKWRYLHEAPSVCPQPI